MSHYTKVKCEFRVREEAHLVRALQKLFGKEHVLFSEEGTLNPKMYHGGNSTISDAAIVVTRRGQEMFFKDGSRLTNDLSFVRKGDTYEVEADISAGYNPGKDMRLMNWYTAYVAEESMMESLKNEIGGLPVITFNEMIENGMHTIQMEVQEVTA